MNLEQLTEIRTSIDNAIAHLRRDCHEDTRTALQTHLDALLKEELRALTGQALEGDLAGFAAQNEKFAQDTGLRKDPEPPAPWYPDDSGEWVEGHPRDLPPETVMSGWLFDTEREGKNHSRSTGLWYARDLTPKAIVAYKVVKP